jgi:hypothetical protein
VRLCHAASIGRRASARDGIVVVIECGEVEEDSEFVVDAGANDVILDLARACEKITVS